MQHDQSAAGCLRDTTRMADDDMVKTSPTVETAGPVQRPAPRDGTTVQTPPTAHRDGRAAGVSFARAPAPPLARPAPSQLFGPGPSAALPAAAVLPAAAILPAATAATAATTLPAPQLPNMQVPVKQLNGKYATVMTWAACEQTFGGMTLAALHEGLKGAGDPKVRSMVLRTIETPTGTRVFCEGLYKIAIPGVTDRTVLNNCTKKEIEKITGLGTVDMMMDSNYQTVSAPRPKFAWIKICTSIFVVQTLVTICTTCLYRQYYLYHLEILFKMVQIIFSTRSKTFSRVE